MPSLKLHAPFLPHTGEIRFETDKKYIENKKIKITTLFNYLFPSLWTLRFHVGKLALSSLEE